MSQPYLGEIRLFGGTFAPVDFMPCDGRLLPIANYDALYSLLGTAYGGDGQTTFALPDMRGRVPVHQGQGRGLPAYALGEPGGTETVTLDATTMAAHAHAIFVNAAPGDQNTPEATRSHIAQLGPDETPLLHVWQPPGANGVLLSPASTSPQGGGQPHDNIQPSTGITYIICINGIYPPQS